MDQQLITLKLESLRRCLNRVADKRPQDLQQLENDLDIQDFKDFARQVATYAD